MPFSLVCIENPLRPPARWRYPLQSLWTPEYLAATASMLSMRLGEIEDGIAGYKAVIAAFKRQGNKNLEASAAAYLALEAARAGSASASGFIKQADDLAKDLRYAPDCKIVLKRAKRWQAAVELRLRAALP